MKIFSRKNLLLFTFLFFAVSFFITGARSVRAVDETPVWLGVDYSYFIKTRENRHFLIGQLGLYDNLVCTLKIPHDSAQDPKIKVFEGSLLYQGEDGTYREMNGGTLKYAATQADTIHGGSTGQVDVYEWHINGWDENSGATIEEARLPSIRRDNCGNYPRQDNNIWCSVHVASKFDWGGTSYQGLILGNTVNLNYNYVQVWGDPLNAPTGKNSYCINLKRYSSATEDDFKLYGSVIKDAKKALDGIFARDPYGKRQDDFSIFVGSPPSAGFDCSWTTIRAFMNETDYNATPVAEGITCPEGTLGCEYPVPALEDGTPAYFNLNMGYTTTEDETNCSGVCHPSGSKPMADANVFSNAVAHELGHAFGLDDEYLSSKAPRSSPISNCDYSSSCANFKSNYGISSIGCLPGCSDSASFRSTDTSLMNITNWSSAFFNRVSCSWIVHVIDAINNDSSAWNLCGSSMLLQQ